MIFVVTSVCYVNLDDVKVSTIVLFEGGFGYDRPSVTFIILNFCCHNYFNAILKPSLTDGQSGYCFVGVIVARNHSIHGLNLIPTQMARIIAYQYSESQVHEIHYTDIKYYCTKRSR